MTGSNQFALQTDATFEKLTTALGGTPLPNIQKLKFSQLQLSDTSIGRFLDLCRNLRSLDVSFTLIKNPHKYLILEGNVWEDFEKLDISCTQLTSFSLLATIKHLSGLRKVVLGAMGSTGSAAAWASATMTNEALDKLTATFLGFQHLHTVSLVGNVKLGFSSTRSLRNFIAEVGRRCKVCVHCLRLVLFDRERGTVCLETEHVEFIKPQVVRFRAPLPFGIRPVDLSAPNPDPQQHRDRR